jgi:L-asparagine transporter-like permease
MTGAGAVEVGRPGELRRALRLRHLIMLSAGGTIASGYLLFAGSAISLAGPSVIISFVVAGIVAAAVMACLAELAVAKPVSSSLSTYSGDTMGPAAGFLTGINYWLAWVMGAATESVAAGTYLHSFYPSVPVWLVAFVIILVEMIINIIGVLLMGEYESLLSTIKMVALGIFIVIGLVAIVGGPFGHHGLQEYTANGGFFPKGSGAVFTALLTVFFAYVGIELVVVAAEETVNPARDIPRALLYTVGIVVALFVAGLFVLLAILKWTSAGTSSSPFVDALKALHLPVVAAIFNWIVIIASVSSVDGGLYTASRMLFTTARSGYLPSSLARTHPVRQTPVNATIVTALAAFVGALLAYLYPASAYVFIASLATFGFLYAWLMISLSQPLYRRKYGREWTDRLRWKTPLYPLTPIVAIVTVVGAFVGQFFLPGHTDVGPVSIPGGGLSVVVGVVWTALWAAYYFLHGRRAYTHGAEWHVREGEILREYADSFGAPPPETPRPGETSTSPFPSTGI